MSRWCKIERAELLQEQIHYDLWMDVEERNLYEKDRELFIQRKKAILLYFAKDLTQQQIHMETGVDPRQLRRLVDRCLSFDRHGQVWGWRGLIPHKNIKIYELTCFLKNGMNLEKPVNFSSYLKNFRISK